MIRKTLLLTIPTVVLLSGASQAFADTNCQSIYGGGETCGNGTITIEKQVLKPGTNDQYVDNLGTNDPHFQPNNPILFKIIVKNTSNATLNNVVVKDTIDPTKQLVDFSSSSTGSFDNSSHTLSYSFNSLTAGQQQVATVAARIVSAPNLPANAVTCATNTAQVTVDNGQPTQASSEYCIDNPNISVTPTPTSPTGQGAGGGPEPTLPVYPPSTNVHNSPSSGPETLPLLGMIPTGAIGMWIRKKASK